MGRIQNLTLAEGIIQGLDLGYPRSGKLFIRNAGTGDLRIAYTETDLRNTTANGQFFTLDPGIVYTFDMSQSSGFLAQNQLLYYVSPTGSGSLELWLAYEE